MSDKTRNFSAATALAPLGLAIAVALGAAGTVNAQYLTSGSGEMVTNSAKECWNTKGGMMPPVEACGDVMPKAVAEPMAMADADGDGVADGVDECANTPRGVRVNALGCPRDSDGDGVPDYLDSCPGTAVGATVNAQGCGMVTSVTINVEGGEFAFDSAALTPAARAMVDGVADKLVASPAREMVEVVGHTDSVGPAAYNQGLSERRAQAVADALMAKGVPAATITVRGVGESEPMAANDTAEGRAENRRVHIFTK